MMVAQAHSGRHNESMRRRFFFTVTLLWSALCAADEVVTASQGPVELGRFVLHRAGELTARLDSATGTTWYLCPTKKGKQQWGWCRTKDIPALPSGPIGRYRLADGMLLLIDSATGRSWIRCDMPTPEKGMAWCALED